MQTWPEGFREQMESLLGGDACAFFRSLEGEHVAALRLNPLRPGAREAAAKFIESPVPWCPDGFYARPGLRPGLSPLHFSGVYYMQEPSAMIPAMILAPQKGERVLDLCAAPGGKSGQIAAALGGEGVLVSNEPDAGRAKALSGNLERLGAACAMVVSAWPDALAAKWPNAFDAVLVDAPCSGEGMFRRIRAARDEWTKDSPRLCAERQSGILDAAARMVKPGGRMVYSTCTFNRLENEETIERFLERWPEFALERFELPGVPAEGGMLRAWPHRLRGEGHFAAKLRKSGTHQPEAAEPIRPDKASAQALSLLASEVFAGELPAPFARWQPQMLGDALWLIPPGMPPSDGLKCLRRGLRVAKVGRGYVQPDHALAMAAGEAARVFALSAEQTDRFLRGHTLDCPVKGWTLATHRGFPLGWGKASGGVLKNHLPKGLRIQD